ncbi:uncharacterized protein EI90DRAFT_3049259 [Cantharellus anzutake]|uniref:uncharacterized protein n=1 Tax=Cantharellus anzutake TaxID=1750568 RepID=UPI0019059C99|nr:uncharacterized protein EI90DRAFT_3049259 [Cantharellus anzutake]KAF8335040.1 hypothetical protein EI90DRAFT_3049259 [Cantharellus anzutake]
MEGREVDLLFGLDMLKAHQACIDLAKNALIIQGREVQFLPEHQLPAKARDNPIPIDEPSSPLSRRTTFGSGVSGNPSQRQDSSFPGTGQALGATRSGSSNTPQPRHETRPSRYPESDISALVGLGVTREQAIRALDAANGNVEIAAGLLF